MGENSNDDDDCVGDDGVVMTMTMKLMVLMVMVLMVVVGVMVVVIATDDNDCSGGRWCWGRVGVWWKL